MRGSTHRRLRLGIALLGLFVTSPGWASQPIPVFGPQSYQRATGKPVAATDRFAVRNPDAAYTLRLDNGGRANEPLHGTPVTSALIRVNGTVVLGPRDFVAGTQSLAAPVDLATDNVISVELRGKPGSVATVEIVHTPVVSDVGPGGGTLADPGGEWELVVPPGAVDEPVTLTVTQGVEPEGGIPGGYLPVGDVLQLEPEGLTFAKPVELRYRYPQGALTENGLEERLIALFYRLDDGSVAEIDAGFDRGTDTATAFLPHFSFVGFLRVGIRLVADGTITQPVVVASIAARVAEALADPPAGQTVEEYFAANADLLAPFLDAVQAVLGEDFIAATFPPVVCQARGCGLAAGCGDLRGLQPGAPWPMFGGCPAHPGRSPFLGAQSPTVKWEVEVGIPVGGAPAGPPFLSSPVIGADGTVYVGSRFWLAAVDRAGTILWQSRPDGSVQKNGGSLSTPAVAADGTLYVGSQDGHLYAIAPEDGAEVWRLATGGPVVSSPVVGADGTIYLGSEGAPGGLLAVTPDGSQLWSFAAGPVSSSPALGSDGTIYVGSIDGRLYAVDASGLQRWAFPTGGPVVSSPAVGPDGTAYVGSADGGLYALAPDGTERWRFPTGAPIATSPALGKDGTVYVGSSDGRLHAVGPDGATRWSLPFGGPLSTAAIGADGTLYVAWSPAKCKKTKLGAGCHGIAAVGAGGDLRWTSPPRATSAQSAPAIGDDGTVYLNLDGVLVALGGDARGGEICSNGIDDDGDGFADCADADCDTLVCDDGNLCTTLDTCSAGSCTGERPASCDDLGECTDDVCDPARGCVSTPVGNGTACRDDASACTDDLCLGGVCTHPVLPSDCGGRACGPSPSGCAACGECDEGFQCTVLGQCLLDLPAQLTPVSVGPAGVPGNLDSIWPALSADGRFVAFLSFADNLVPADTNQAWDVFRHDRWHGDTTRLSVGSDGRQGDDHSWHPELSADGGSAAFLSWATGLVPGDTNGREDLFVHDQELGETQRVNLGTRGEQSGGGANQAVLSADGRWVAFTSSASDLVAGDTNGGQDVFVRDLERGVTRRVSVDSAGRQASGSATPSISGDGRFVTFVGYAVGPDLVEPYSQIFVHDRITGQTTHGSVSSEGTPGGGHSFSGSLSGDGRFVVFVSAAPDLVPGDTNGVDDVFVHDRLTGTTTRISVGSAGEEADDSSLPAYPQAASDDGRFVVFVSRASNLVPGAGDGTWDLYLHDRLTGDTVRLLDNPSADVPDSALSADGRFVALESSVGLVPADDNGRRDIYTAGNPLWIAGEADCRDGLDDDLDGVADCIDADCADDPVCLGLEAECGDGVDDDGDGLTDCADADCATRSCGDEKVCLDRSCSVPGCGDVGGLQSGAPWPMRGGCPTHRGRGGASSPASPGIRWTFPADVSVDISSPAVATDGTVYLPSRDGLLYAVAEDGVERWRFAAGGPLLSSPAIAADGTVYVGSADGFLYAVGPDGGERWRFATGAAVVSSPAIGPDGVVYFGSDDDHLYAVGQDGSERWRFTTGANVASSPALGPDGTAYVGSYDGNLYAIGPDGGERWRFATGAAVSSPAVGRDGAVYLGSFDGRVYAVNPDGSERWTFDRLHSTPVISSPALGADGTVYIGGDDGRLWAIDPGGTLRWTFLTSGPVKPTPAVDADGTILATSIDGTLYAIAPDGAEVWRFAAWQHWPLATVLSSPAIGADGTVYFGTDVGPVVALGEGH